jgi:hypothetical protein
MSWWNSSKTFPMRIFLVALILRLIPVVVMRNMGIGLDDMFQYDMLARSISTGNGYRWYAEADLPIVLPYLKLDLSSINYDSRGVLTSFRPPLYPAFLAIIYFVFGTGPTRFFIARIFQAILAACMAPLTYAVAKRLFRNRESTAKISTWIIVLYPMLVVYPLSLATENLFFVLVLSSFLCLLKAQTSLETAGIPGKKISSLIIRSRWFILSGFLLGLTCLTRSVAQIYAVMAMGWVWLFLKERKMAIIVFMVAGVTVSPWIARNSLLYGKLTGIETAIGYDLYLGYHPQGTGTFQYPQSLDLMTMMNDSERDSIGIQSAIGFIKTNPGRVLYLILRRTGYFFGLESRALTYFYSNDFFGYLPPPLIIGILTIFCLPFTIIVTSAVFGLAQTGFKTEIWLLVLLLIGYAAPHMLIITEDRFHLALVPFLSILAARCWTGGWSAIIHNWFISNQRKTMMIAAFIIVFLLVINWGMQIGRNADKLATLMSPNGNQSYFSY